METLTSGLARLDAIRLRGCGSRNPSNRWLETLVDMAHCHSRWRSCIRDFFFFCIVFLVTILQLMFRASAFFLLKQLVL